MYSPEQVAQHPSEVAASERGEEWYLDAPNPPPTVAALELSKEGDHFEAWAKESYRLARVLAYNLTENTTPSEGYVQAVQAASKQVRVMFVGPLFFLRRVLS